MSKTSIEWTDDSHNPIRARLRDAAHAGLTRGGYGSGVGHYCEKISSGCAHCYSSTTQPRFGMPEFLGVQNGEPAVDVFLDEVRLVEPLSWRRPRKVFLCDMTDLFGPWVPFEWIDKIFAVMALTPHITWQILTKRPERMAEYLATRTAIDDSHRVDRLPQWYQVYTRWFDEGYGGGRFFDTERDWDRAHDAAEKVDPTRTLSNIWLGTSCEDKKRADERIPHLLRCPAAIRFLSCEPLLGPIDFGDEDEIHGPFSRLDLGLIHWVIVGGESGPSARPCASAWITSIIEQCRAASVACFVKQLGSKPVNVGGLKFHPVTLKSSKGGDPSEWHRSLCVREMPVTSR